MRGQLAVIAAAPKSRPVERRTTMTRRIVRTVLLNPPFLATARGFRVWLWRSRTVFSTVCRGGFGLLTGLSYDTGSAGFVGGDNWTGMPWLSACRNTTGRYSNIRSERPYRRLLSLLGAKGRQLTSDDNALRPPPPGATAPIEAVNYVAGSRFCPAGASLLKCIYHISI